MFPFRLLFVRFYYGPIPVPLQHLFKNIFVKIQQMNENPTKPTQLHLTERLRAELSEQASKERRSMSSLAEELIALGLNTRRQAIEDRIDQVLHGRG